MIWVTGADLRTTPRALERLPAGSRYVVAPGALRGVRPGVRGGGLRRAAWSSARGEGWRRERPARPHAGRPLRRRPGRLDVSAPARAAPSPPVDPLPMRLVAFAALAGVRRSRTGARWSSDAAGRRGCCSCCSSPPAAARLLALLGRAPIPRAAMHLARAVVVVIAMLAARADGGRPARRLLLPGALGRALRRPRPRPARASSRSSGRTTGRTSGSASRSCSARPPFLTIAPLLTFWPARGAAPRAARRRPRHAAAPLRHGGRRATTPARRRCAGSCCSSWWPPGCGCRVSGAARRSSPARWCSASACCRCRWRPRSTRDQPWWDYHAWNWFGGGKVITFDWNHSYGPLNWSRAGDDRPERQVGPAALLEGRDARRLRRLALDPHAELDDTHYGTQVAYTEPRDRGPLGLQRVQPELGRAHPLHGEVAVQPVRGRRRRGAPTWTACRRASRRTTARRGSSAANRLEEGDTYSVRAYAPNPTRAQMQDAPEGYAAKCPVHGDPAAAPGRVRDRRAGGADARGARERGRSARAVFVPLR